MARAEKTYTRLTRSTGGVGTYSSLWLAADHLMLVTSTGYSESYARVQLGDIKGIFVTPTDRRLWWAIGWGVPAVCGGIPFLVSLGDAQPPIASGIFFGIGAIGLVWNHLLGPGCRAFVVTGVQTAKLPSLVRLKKTRLVLARVQPLIDAAQAHLAPPPIVPPPVAPPSVEPAPAAEASPAPEPPAASG